MATVALQYRMQLSLEKLRDLTETDREGTSPLGLLEAAEQIPVEGGFHFTRKGRKRVKRVKRLKRLKR